MGISDQKIINNQFIQFLYSFEMAEDSLTTQGSEGLEFKGMEEIDKTTLDQTTSMEENYNAITHLHSGKAPGPVNPTGR